jgi:hypothetical protein
VSRRIGHNSKNFGNEPARGIIRRVGRVRIRTNTDTTAQAITATRDDLRAAWAMACLVRSGRRVPRSVAVAVTADRRARIDVYRILRAMSERAPLSRPTFLDAPTRLTRAPTMPQMLTMIDTLRTTHDLADRELVRAAVNNYRGVILAKFHREQSRNEGV